jgi:hypothetical protein
MSSRLRNALVAGAAAIALVVSASGPAVSAAPAPVTGGPAGADQCSSQASAARSTATVASLQSFGDCEITRRLATLHLLAGLVDDSNGLTPADAARLSAEIAGARGGLTNLRGTIDAQTRIVPLKADLIQIVNNYRVYVLLGPQVRLAIAADSELALKSDFDALATTLAGRITAAAANGKDVAAAQIALAAMKAAVAEAVGLAGPVPARLAALTPANYVSAGAQTVIRNARIALAAARDRFKAAAEDGRNVLLDLS